MPKTLPLNPLSDAYEQIYGSLAELRESFHRTGRLDDSNAKLDEVSKLFATYLSFKNNKIKKFPKASDTELIEALQQSFAKTAILPDFALQNGGSIFGHNPVLSLKDGDEKLAKQLVAVITEAIDIAFDLKKIVEPFDLLNEAFGHFVRDNFRSNIEDAQYMTPPEVVEFMTNMILHDLSEDEPNLSKKNLIFCDPTCGVGSFLTSIYQTINKNEHLDAKKISLLGQDKVERMVRLSTINLALANASEHKVFIGNSLEDNSPISEYNGKVDVILTNPPFGARFSQLDVQLHFANNLDFFGKVNRNSTFIDSELLFIDRDLKLLKEGGVLLIVVPDGVISAKGLASTYRQFLSQHVQVKAIIELPPTTFAQAGTRTKTSILYLKKTKSAISSPIFMAVVKDIGFQVATRKGIQVKIPSGKNELLDVLLAYKKVSRRNVTRILSDQPSCVQITRDDVLNGTWTPNHHNSSRLRIVQNLTAKSDYVMTPLRDLVNFGSEDRKTIKGKQGNAFISILHVLGEGFIDMKSALTNTPKTAGYPVSPGELLISKINPRIPRVCLVPDLGVETICSTEFEIMTPKTSIQIAEIAYLLQSEIVQTQIVSLTSGTSSSHNRIRTSELGGVLVPIPKPNTGLSERLQKVVKEYRIALDQITLATKSLADLRRLESEVLD